jgi:RNA polymerase sigma factor (TIGR02999 family)
MEASRTDLTELIRLAGSGETGARDRLFETLYSDLRRLAAVRMQFERGSHTLSATALVHETYLRLFGSLQNATYRDSGHFFAVASQAMRRILVDHARARNAEKRGGPLGPAPAAEHPAGLPDIAAPADRDEQLLALDQALTALRELSPRQCQVVELRYFGGLTEQQVADALQVARRTVNRDWRMARAWLHSRLGSSSWSLP